MAPKSSLPATISLVSGAPLVKFFHSTSYLASLYWPSWGRYLSSRPSSRINRPPAAQLIVVSWVPMAMRMVSAEADKVNDASTRPAKAARNMSVSPRIIYRMFVSATIRAWWETRGVFQFSVRCRRMAFFGVFVRASSLASQLPQGSLVPAKSVSHCKSLWELACRVAASQRWRSVIQRNRYGISTFTAPVGQSFSQGMQYQHSSKAM
ncbi:hypothetical protein D3C81_921960 [compost metagenome]